MPRRRRPTRMLDLHERISEKEFLGQVREAARLFGWMVYHTHDSRRSEPGFPDLVLVRGHRLLFIELKVGMNRLTVAQTNWLDALREAGANVCIARPENWVPLMDQLRADA